MNMKTLLFVRPNGRVEGIYSDLIPHIIKRPLIVERAGNVEYDNERQGWTVVFPDGRALHTVFLTRAPALKAEEADVLGRLYEAHE